MAGRRKEQIAPSAALVASAVTFSGPGKVENVYRPMEAWQKEAWDYYDITPELRFAATWIAQAMSRCLLKPGEINADGEVVASTDRKTAAALREITGGGMGQSQLLNYIGLHLTVAGEGYLVGRAVPKTQAVGADKQQIRVWEMVGVREISQAAGGWSIQSSIDNSTVRLRDDDVVVRIWRGHPAYRYQADSPVRALLPVLSEIKYLTLHIFAQTISRLVGAGTWVLPKSVEIPGVENDSKKAEGIVKKLGEIMSRSIVNPGDPSSLVPLIMLVADDAVDKMKPPIHFWSPFDEKASDARKAAIWRFGTGFDLPPEVISGMSANMSTTGGRGTGLSHWGQWQIEESAIKMHIEPLLDVATNALVLNIIRPLTKNPRAAILTDTIKLKLQPDRSREANEAHAVGALSDEGLRFYTGLAEDYAPNEKDIATRILWNMANTAAPPEMVLRAAEKLGVDLGLTVEDVAGARAPHSPDHPLGRDLPQRSIPERNTALLPVAEALVLRALEKAGNRLRNAGVKPEGVPAHEVHTFAAVNGNAAKLLDDAWAHVPLLCGTMCDADQLTSALQAYTESLLTQRALHSRDALAQYLSLVH